MKKASGLLWSAAGFFIAISVAMPALTSILGVLVVVVIIGMALALVSGIWSRR